jgi:LacI family transcriptional regulator
MNRTTRIVDIARDLGVSTATVSKALSDEDDISPAMKKRVLERCRELNYWPNLAARGLVTGRTYVIGLVIPDLRHSFFANIAMGIMRKVHPAGYTLVFVNSVEDPELERSELEQLVARKVDGIILASAQHRGYSRVLRELQTHQVPFVLIDRPLKGVKADFVGADDEEIGRLATGHLIQRGCRAVAHVGCPQVATGPGRFKGYQTALAEAGLQAAESYIAEAANSIEAGQEAMSSLLRLRSRPDGVFCFNDLVAAGAMKAILDAGLRIPEDIAIIGTGNLHYSDLLRVPLSSIDPDSSRIGEQAADFLLERIGGKSPRSPRIFLMPLKLVVRDSSRAALGAAAQTSTDEDRARRCRAKAVRHAG